MFAFQFHRSGFKARLHETIFLSCLLRDSLVFQRVVVAAAAAAAGAAASTLCCPRCCCCCCCYCCCLDWDSPASSCGRPSEDVDADGASNLPPDSWILPARTTENLTKLK